MVKLLLLSLIIIPTLSNAAIIREINGVEYNLHDDFVTAQGECVLRGKDKASDFNSSGYPTRKVVKLHSDGSIKEVLEKMDINTWVITEVRCL
jgi:hypothetical protein